MDKLEEFLLQIELTMKHNKEFELALTTFETQKFCYLPLNAFLLKPIQRLLHFRLFLESKLDIIILSNCVVFHKMTHLAISCVNIFMKSHESYVSEH